MGESAAGPDDVDRRPDSMKEAIEDPTASVLDREDACSDLRFAQNAKTERRLGKILRDCNGRLKKPGGHKCVKKESRSVL